MKMKLTTLLFGLLLAVGWTSNASAQALPDQGLAEKLTIAVKAPPVERGEYVGISASRSHSHGTFTQQQTAPIKAVKEGTTRPINAPLRAGVMLPMKSLTRVEADALTYTWTDEGGASHTSKSTEAAKDPYQMYELLKFVYTDKRFPGPYYSAYTMNDERERKVYYGAVGGGWDIDGPVLSNTPVNQVPDIKIVATNGGYIRIRSITVYDENNRVLTSWDYNGNYETVAIQGNNYQQYTLPLGWSADGWYFLRGYFTTGTFFTTTYYYGYITSGSDPGSITISSYLLEGHSSVRVVVNASASSNNQTLNVNNLQSRTVTTSTNNGGTNYEWTINAQSYSNVEYDPDYYLPNEEGYTALMVSVKNDGILQPDDEGYSQISTFTQKSEIINYFKNNVDSIKLLTDGLRIGAGSDYSCGTVFNCDGIYNKFFMLGKGQARQKADASRQMEIFAQHPMGEQVPFKFMFEEFSPTGGETGSQITDFYSRMMDGKVYNVVHDCASVIQNGHQFSMSGNEGTTSYGMTGLNFFIPDYRLKYWTDQYYLGEQGPYNVDGRIMNPYMTESADGDPSFNMSLMFTTPSDYVAWYAQYNQLYAPKVGIYRITLEAEAVSVGEYGPGNMFNVTLTWVSSLNEMSGHEVPQTYTIYLVDEEGNLTALTAEGVTNPTGVTTVTYQVPQDEHSYTITYIIEGSPDDNEHPSFVAWSNLDDVVIPGYKDFMALVVDHYESDFIIHKENYVGNEGEHNYYRNFLHVASDNEDNALTVERINAGENKFTLYRYDVSNEDVLYPVGELTFQDRHDNRNVQFGFTYDANNPQDILRPASDTQKYTLVAMGIPNQGDLRIKGNGDLVIQPNGYDVNFRSISVYNGDDEVASWTAPNELPSGWILSPGSLWEDWSIGSTRTRYIDGGGYIAIPELLNTYDNLRVEINAFGDGSKIAKIAVNDETKTIANNNIDYTETWNVTSDVERITYYQKVTSTDNLTMGDEYLIVYETDNVAFNGALTDLDVGHNVIDVTRDGNRIESNTTTDAATFTITAYNTQYYIRSKSGYYIGYTGGSGTGLTTNTNTSSTYRNYITFSDGNVLIGGNNNNANNRRYLQFNSSSGDNNYRFRYYGQNNQKAIQLYKKVTETVVDGDRMVRLGNLPIVDQFSAETKYNTHPSRYGYVLKYEPAEGEAKESSHAEVPVQHTGSVVNGYYTEQQVIEDTDRSLETDMLTADMQMTLSESNSAIFYYDIEGKLNDNPTEYQDYESQLQRQTNFTYIEMKPTSDVYGKVYDPGIHHYYDSVAVKGTYGEYKTYVPSVMTEGFDRRYYEYDGLHNTYGAPIWKTGVGKVENIVATAQRQDGAYGSTNWTDANGNDCSLYFLEVSATGVLPDYSNVEYEPYMYRVWVYSPSGKLRGYSQVLNPGTDPDNTGDAGSHLVDDPTADRFGPICVYEELNNTTSFYKPLSSTWAENICFGAVNMADATANEDLIVIVRFYFRSKGSSAGNSNMFRAEGDDETPMYNATESESSTNIATSVSEVRYSGEVVSQTFINVQGQMSDKPFDGVNIVVTRYSDGTTSVSKVVK